MITLIRMRLAGAFLAKKLRRSLLVEINALEVSLESGWKTNTPHDSLGSQEPKLTSSIWLTAGMSRIATGPFTLMLVPRRIRVLDGLYVCWMGQEVWIPLIARIRLRAAVRLWLATAAIHSFYNMEGI